MNPTIRSERPRRSLANARSIAIGIALPIIAGAAWSQPPLETGDAAEITEDGLHRVAVDAMDAAWVRPGLDLSGYDALYIRPSGVSFRTVEDEGNRAGRLVEQTDFVVPDELKIEMRSDFEEAFRTEFSSVSDYPVSTVPGRTVVMVQGFLVDVTTSLPPEEAGAEFIQNLHWEATIVLELRDSMSDDILARTVERERVQEIVDSDFVQEQVRQLCRRWARLLQTRLGELDEIAG